MLTLMLSAFFLIVVLGGWVVIGMLVASILYIVYSGQSNFTMIAIRTVSGMDMFPILAVPFFLLAGDLMNQVGVTQALVRFSAALVGRIRGGLAHVNVVTGMIMAGVSGSANADTAALASVFVPAMEKGGYPRAFAAALSACAGAIGPIIPPSINMVLIGSLGNISIGKMFLGGAVPGAMMGLFLMGYSYVLARRRGYGAIPEQITWAEFFRRFRAAAFPLMVPGIIIGGIVGGIVTPTEAGVLAVAAILVVGAVSTRQLTLGKVIAALRSCVHVLGALMLVLGVANVFSWILGQEKVGQQLTDLMLSITGNPLVMLLLINLVMLLLGCLMDVMPLLMVLTPILVPVVVKLGIDPVHFGVVFAFVLTLGLITPPYGQAMFVACGVAKIRIVDFAREGWLMILLLAVVLLLITFFPPLVLFVPQRLMP